MVEDLVGVGKVQAEHLRVATGCGKSGLDVRTTKLGAQGDDEAVDRGVLPGGTADGVEVHDVPPPVLQRDVTKLCAFPDEKLYRAVAERRLLIVDGSVLVYVRHARVLLDQDEGARHYGANHVEPAV